eukprot:gene8354-biopygen6121
MPETRFFDAFPPKREQLYMDLVIWSPRDLGDPQDVRCSTARECPQRSAACESPQDRSHFIGGSCKNQDVQDDFWKRGEHDKPAFLVELLAFLGHSRTITKYSFEQSRKCWDDVCEAWQPWTGMETP